MTTTTAFGAHGRRYDRFALSQRRTRMKVLVLSKYGHLAASPRHRFLQYAPHLAEHGIELTFSPLFDNAYLKQRFDSGRAPPPAVLRAYARRVLALLTTNRWDLAWVHCELFPYWPGVTERALRLRGLPYVYDYDDAIFHMYDEHRLPVVRTVLGRKLAPVIGGAQAVIAGSGYLARYAERFNSRVTVVPTVVDMKRYGLKPERPATDRLTVGWIGSRSTSEHLEVIAPALRALATEVPLKLIATGARPLNIPGVDVEVRPWSEDSEVQDLHEADVGIMPLPDRPWTRGKCAFKLIQYMAAGLPTVSSPVGANSEVVNDETGLFASTTEEWVAALRRLRDSVELRKKLGLAGRARALKYFSLESQKDRVRKILEQAERSGRPVLA